MKLYDSNTAPNPRRLRIFIAEKGIEIPTEQVDIGKLATRSPEFLAINPLGRVPVLELDDGSRIAESIAICRYLEALHPRLHEGSTAAGPRIRRPLPRPRERVLRSPQRTSRRSAVHWRRPLFDGRHLGTDVARLRQGREGACGGEPHESAALAQRSVDTAKRRRVVPREFAFSSSSVFA